MKKLKSIDFKALFINHGEKFGLALIALFVLIALSGTSWSRFEKSPDELDAKVKDAKNRITSPQNIWPQSEKDKYVVVDFTDQANQVFVGLANSTSKYEFTTPLFWPLYRKKEKAREPEYSAPQLLIADPGMAILQISNEPKLPESPDGIMPDGPGTAPDSTLKPGSNLKPGPGGAGPTAGPHGGGTSTVPYGIRPATVPSSGHGSSAQQMISSINGEMPGYGGYGSNVSAQGVRYIAVRAIVPIKEQIERAMKALNMTYADASAAIEYTDFILQRQTAVAGPDPWSGPWVDVNIETAKKFLRECSDFDPDPVPYDLQDAVFTMPLPFRILRYWGDDATHPHIKHFQLSEEEIKREEKLYSKLMEEAEKLNLQSKPKIERKGLSDSVNDLRGTARTVMVSGEMNNVMSTMMQSMNEGGVKMAVGDIKSRLTASGRLYLFRYFDFEVEPGMAYRYRLKLELKNPNFERPYEEVEHEAFTRGAYRTTDWSNISNPAVVPNAVNYFLKDVERDPVREDRHSKKPVATIAMFQAHESLGTMLADSLKILSVGQFIAEKKKSWILDPATPSFEEKEVQFTTEDVLVDASGDLELSPDAHPDLQLKADRGKRETRLGLLPEALVATGLGELKELDPVSEVSKEKVLDKRVEEERRNFLYLKEQPKEEKSRLDGGPYATPPMPGARPGDGDMAPRKSSMKKSKGAEGAHGGAGGAHSGGSAGGSAGGGRSKPPRRQSND